MTTQAEETIAKVLDSCVARAIKRVSKQKSFRPFHDALLTEELVSASALERSFSTSFGQGPIEEISQILAIANGAECTRQKETRVNVNKGAVDEIGRILASLRSGDSRPNWNKELDRILAFKKGDYIQERVLSDLWIKKGGLEKFISIKTVKPNIDQAEKAKHDMLLLKAHDSTYETYFGLYYNPGGPKKENYNWSIPSKIFDMHTDPCVLIGEEYWDTIGGKGSYTALLKIFKKIGMATKDRLSRIIK